MPPNGLPDRSRGPSSVLDATDDMTSAVVGVGSAMEVAAMDVVRAAGRTLAMVWNLVARRVGFGACSNLDYEWS